MASPRIKQSPTMTFLSIVAAASAALVAPTAEASVPVVDHVNLQLVKDKQGVENGALVSVTFKPDVPVFVTVEIGKDQDGKIGVYLDLPQRNGRVRGQFRPNVTEGAPAVSIRVGKVGAPDGVYLMNQVPAGYLRSFGDEIRTVAQVLVEITKKMTPDMLDEGSSLRKDGYIYDKGGKTYLSIPMGNFVLMGFASFGDDGHLHLDPTGDVWGFINSAGRCMTSAGEATFRGGPVGARAEGVCKKIWEQILNFKVTKDGKETTFKEVFESVTGKNYAQRQKERGVEPRGMASQSPPEYLRPQSLTEKTQTQANQPSGSVNEEQF